MNEIIYCGINDIIHAHFGHSGESFTGRVIEIIERNESYTFGAPKAGRLIKAVSKTRTQTFDESFITAIISKGKSVGQRKENIFRNHPETGYNYSRGKYCGPLSTLVAVELSKLNKRLTTFLDEATIHKLYDRQRKPGYAGHLPDMESIFIINKKPFRKWVQKNADRLVMSKRKDWKIRTGMNKRDNEELEKDLEKMWDDFMDELEVEK